MSDLTDLKSIDDFVDVVRDTFTQLSGIVADLIEAKEVLSETENRELQELVGTLDSFEKKLFETMFSTFHSIVAVRSALAQHDANLKKLRELLLKNQHGGRV